MSDPVHHPQVLSEDWLLLREDMIYVLRRVATGLYAILARECHRRRGSLDCHVPRQAMDTRNGAQLVTLLAFVDLRKTECDIEVVEALDMAKERFSTVDSRRVEPDDLVGIQAELYRQQLLGELYIGAIKTASQSVALGHLTLRLTGGPLADRPVEAVVSRRWLCPGLRDLLPAETEVLLRKLIGGIHGYRAFEHILRFPKTA